MKLSTTWGPLAPPPAGGGGLLERTLAWSVGAAVRGRAVLRALLTTRAALGAILLVGLVLRVETVGFGHHWLTFQPDEDSNISIALRLSWHDLNPHAFYYPDLSWYLLFGVNWLAFWTGQQLGIFSAWGEYRGLFDSHPLPFFLLGRGLSVALGTATIALVYLLGRRLYRPAHGLVAAAFLAVAFLHVRDSALATPDAPMACFVVLSLVGAAGILRYGRGRDYALAAVGAALATATKYNAILLVLALLTAHGLRGLQDGRPMRRMVFAPRLLVALALSFLTFFVVDPYLLLDWAHAREGLAWQWNYSQTGQYLDIGPAWRYHLTVSLYYGMGLGLLALAAAGLARALWRREPGGLVLASFAVPFFLQMGTLRAIFVRYMTPLVPVLCLFAAVALIGLARLPWTRTARRIPTWLPVAVGVLVLIEPLHSTVAHSRLVHHVDTRVLTYRFLQTLPDGLDVATYGPSVTWRSTLPRWAPDFYAKVAGEPWTEALAKLRERGVRYFLIHHSRLDVFSPVSPALEAALREAGTPIRLFSPYRPGAHPRPVYDRVDAHFFPVSGFDGVERPGPLVIVYRLNRGRPQRRDAAGPLRPRAAGPIQPGASSVG